MGELHASVLKHEISADFRCRFLHLDACMYDDPQIVNDLYLRCVHRLQR